MNCSKANQLNINLFLSKIGMKGKTQGRNLTVYFSPFRKDNNPSFCVYSDSNRWHDFGTGENGDLVSLVKKIYSCSTSDALEILSKDQPQQPKNVFSFIKQKSFEKVYSTDQAFIDARLTAVTNKYLIDYLSSRGISWRIWSQQDKLFQINYKNLYHNQLKEYTNLAWQNDSKGYEIRGTGEFKSCYGTKDITTIPGAGNDLNLFEGFFDYMSCLVYFKTPKLKNTTIILNSLANIKKARPAIEKADLINLFLDNDPAGAGAANNLQAMFGNCINRSLELYPNFHDFNDFLLNKRIP